MEKKIEKGEMKEMYKKNKLKAIVAFAVALAFVLPTSAVFVNNINLDITIVRFDPPEQTVEKGEMFTASYYVEPTDWVAGAFFETITFDPTLLQVVGDVAKGGFFGGKEAAFDGGTVDNVAGTISDGIAAVVPANAVYEPGAVYVITFMAQDEFGTSSLVMSGLEGLMIAGKESGQYLEYTLERGSVTVGCPPEYFELTINVVGSGTTDPMPGTYTYSEGTVVDLEAIHDIDWLFDHWDGDVADPYSAITNITMDADKDVIATFTKEDTPPVTICILDPPEPDGDNGWYVSVVTVTLVATDEGSGVESTWYRIYDIHWKLYTRPFEVSQEGEHTVEYYSLDKAGNYEDIKSADFKIDKTSPVTEHELEGFIGEDGWFLTNVNITLSATDATSGVNFTKYKLDDGDWITYEEFFIVTEDGDYTLYYYSVDLAGNIEMTNEVEFKIEKDTTPPETNHAFDGIIGDNDWFTSNVVVALTAEDDSSGVAFTYYKLDDDVEKEYKEPILVTEDGEHTITYYSVDKIGNEEDVNEAKFNIDQTKPTIVLDAEGAGSTWLLKATVSDETSGIAKVEFYVAGKYLGEVTSKPYEWKYTGARRGDIAQAIAYDKAGNLKISNEKRSQDPDAFIGWTFLIGWISNVEVTENIITAQAIRLRYIEIAPTGITVGFVKMKAVEFSSHNLLDRRTLRSFGQMSPVIGIFKGGIIIEDE